MAWTHGVFFSGQSSKVNFFLATIFSNCCYITNFELEIICFMSLRLDWIMKMITFQAVYHLHRLTRKYLDQQTSSSNLWYLLLRFSPTFMCPLSSQTYLHAPPLISKLKASGEKRKGNRAHKLEAKAVLLLVWHLWSRLTLFAADIYWIFAETLAGCTRSST